MVHGVDYTPFARPWNSLISSRTVLDNFQRLRPLLMAENARIPAGALSRCHVESRSGN